MRGLETISFLEAQKRLGDAVAGKDLRGQGLDTLF